MKALIQLAWRDARPARRKLALFGLSICLGVAALVAIGSLSDNLRANIDAQTKALLGSDLAVTTRQARSEEQQKKLGGIGERRTEEVMLNSMLSISGPLPQLRMVQVRALEPEFPFFGTFETVPAGAAALLQAGDNIIVEESLAQQFALLPGAQVRLGNTTFTVLGTLKKIPGESMSVALLAPRVFIPRSALPSTGLIGPGSLVRYRTHFALKSGEDPREAARKAREALRDLRPQVETIEDRKRELGRALEHVETFLNLVGFVALLLGAIGVASALQVYIRQKLPQIAVLRCLGATSRQAMTVYVLQGLALGAIGACAGGVLGLIVQFALPTLFGGLLPVDVQFGVSWPALFKGLGVGAVIGGLFILLPLTEVRRVPPLAALRSAFASTGKRIDPLRIALGVAIGGALTAFAILQTHSLRRGIGFAVALVVALGLLAAAAKLLSWLARRFSAKALPYVLRQGIANLHRPDNRTVLLLVTLGLGTMLVTTIDCARATLLSTISVQVDRGRANLLFFDIQNDQIARVKELLAQAGAPAQQTAPIVTMKLSHVGERPVRELLRDRSSGAAAWTLTREYRSTYRSELGPTEKIVAGSWTGKVNPGEEPVPISVEQRLARDLGVGLGDALTFDVQGVPVQTRIASLREVEWRRLEPNFFVVFPAGAIDDAPQAHVVAVHAASAEASARLQQAVVGAFPTISAIDIALVLGTVEGILGKVEWAIRFMALFVTATGIVVLAGAMLIGRQQRIRETVLLRTMGATQSQLRGMQLVEYAVLGLLAGALGCGLAAGANEALARFIFKIPAAWPWGAFAGVLCGVSVLTVVTGWLANRGIATHPPLAVLRQET